MNADEREMKDPELIIKSANEAIKALDEMKYKNHVDVPMSEYVKILIWEKENLYDIQHAELMKEVAKDKADGWKVIEHTFYGQDFETYKI